MDQYIVSARKYRPTTFDSVVGQHALTQTLKNAIASGRLAHAYLFCGPRGVGKTTCARIFAKTINCLAPRADGEACNECESCRAFNEGRSFNIHELDAASNNSVEDIRALIEQVRIPPQVGKYKVFIIDEVHMLSQQAFNAFLKTLEEPPRHAVFILATTEKHKILPTILSRCQIYDFNRMEVADIVSHLKRVAEAEHISYEDDALNVIAQKADGGMRDALSIFDQVSSFSNGNITYRKVIEDLNVLDYEYYFKVVDLCLAADATSLMLTLNEVLEKGFDAGQFIGGLAEHFRNLLVSRDAATLPLLEVAETVRPRYGEQARRCNPKFLFRALKLCNRCDQDYRTSRNKRLLVEIVLLEVMQAAHDDDEAGAGPRPRTLKPLFPKEQVAAAAAAQQPASEVQATPRPVAAPAPAPTASAATPQAPAAAASPAGAPQLHTAPQAPRAAVKLGRLKTISIHGKPKESAPGTQEAAGETAELPEERQAVAQADLQLPWLRFANMLPREQAATASRMKNMKPQLVAEELIRVEVENEEVRKDLQAIAADILRFMRTELHNTHVQLQIGLSDRKSAPRPYTRREQLEAIIKKYPDVEKMRQALRLELM